jgi:hypothetical protein
VPTGLSEDKRTQWAAGVEFYKPYVPRDLLLDDGMVAINSRAESVHESELLPERLVNTLEFDSELNGYRAREPDKRPANFNQSLDHNWSIRVKNFTRSAVSTELP